MKCDHDYRCAGCSQESNLWLACSLCNDHKSNRIAAPDAESGETVRLFDPRRQAWTEHFHWTEQADEIIGLTPIGRATVAALQLRPALVEPSALGFRGLASANGLNAGRQLQLPLFFLISPN